MMKTQFFTHRERIPVGRLILSITAILLGILLLLNACASATPQPAKVEEITFQPGEFKLAGDLRTPAGTSPFLVVLFVHGDLPGTNRSLPFEVKSLVEFDRRGISAYRNLNL